MIWPNDVSWKDSSNKDRGKESYMQYFLHWILRGREGEGKSVLYSKFCYFANWRKKEHKHIA